MPPALHHSPRPRPQRAAALALLSVLTLLGACATVVEGEAVSGALPAAVSAPIDPETASLRADYDRSVDEVNDYWSDDRRTDAAPFDPLLPPGGGTGAPDASTGVIVDPTTGPVNPDGPQTAPDASGALFQATGLAAATQGRLYMTVGGSNMVCSATVVNSAGRNLIATAAHCVWDMDANVLADYVSFVPADAQNASVAPYGQWAAESVILPNQFADLAEVDADGITGEGWAYDFAFVQLAPNDQGQLIQDVTGGQGIAFGIPAQELLVTGYPSAPPFDGTTQHYCAANDWEAYYWAYGIDCAMTPGSSGGGWMTNYDPATGSGYLVATTSFGNADLLGAAPLGATALALFTSIGGLP